MAGVVGSVGGLVWNINPDANLNQDPVYYAASHNKKCLAILFFSFFFCVLHYVPFTSEVCAGNDVIPESTTFQYNKWGNLNAAIISNTGSSRVSHCVHFGSSLIFSHIRTLTRPQIGVGQYNR